MIASTLASAIVQCNGVGASAQGCDTGLPSVSANNATLQVILQTVFGIAGGTAVIIIIVSAIRLSASQGNPQEATKARSAIIYAAAGLVAALSAELIVTFVLGNI